jgi:DNA modification methylase
MKNSSNLFHDYKLHSILKRDAEAVDKLLINPDLIYLDPPFGTQRTFRLKTENHIGYDDFWKSQDEYIDWLKKIVVKLFAKLNNKGTMYIHNNFESNALLFSVLPKEIRRNFLTTIHWMRSHPHNNISLSWGNIVDTILVFGKTKKPYFQTQYTELDKTYAKNSFNNIDNKGKYALAPITGERSRIGYHFEYKGFNPKYGWRKKIEDIKSLDEQGLIHFGSNKPYKKVYLDESNGRPIQNIWFDIFPITRTEKDRRSYPTQKPVKLLKRILLSSCPKDGIALDPFAGSGSLLRAAMEINSEKDYKIKTISSDLNDDAVKLMRAIVETEDNESLWPIK